MNELPSWETDGRAWPHRDKSSFVRSGGLSWHVQEMGSGSIIFLIHGTGASTHSFRALAPILAGRYRVISVDLPGHAYTRCLSNHPASLPHVALALGRLLRDLDAVPVMVVGHSAGAAIALRMVLDRSIEPRLLVSINGALLPFAGVSAGIFSGIARLMTTSSIVARMIAFHARDRKNVERLVRGTGSSLDEQGIELYQTLAMSPGHISGVLRMMAAWDLRPLERELDRISIRTLLIAGARDKTVPPSQCDEVAARIRHHRSVVVPNAGHLVHEELPEEVARVIFGSIDEIENA